MQQVRPRARARLARHSHPVLLRNNLSYLVKRGRHAGHYIKRTVAAVRQGQCRDFRHVIHQHMVTPLFAFSEDRNRLPFSGLPAESVGTIPVMRIGSPVDQGGPQHGYRRFGGVF
jgi:hypothetical protein